MYFLDNASTTACDPAAAKIVADALVNDFFNPSARYGLALNEKNKLEDCRKQLLKTVGAINYGCIFTASATESNNIIINSGTSKNYLSLISVGEHSSVNELAKKEVLDGRKIEYLNLEQNGRVSFDDFKNKMTKSVGFVSIMLVSNETGAINSVKKFVQYAKRINPKVLFHVDAVQAFCKIPINLEDIGADYLTLSSHKIHGPKGVGALIFKKSTKLVPYIVGGGQEFGLRAGTENLPSVLGFVYAANKYCGLIEENYEKVLKFKKDLIENLQKEAELQNVEFSINGDVDGFSPYILSVSFPKIKAEVLLHKLEDYDIYVGTGSACSSKDRGNRILSAMGKSEDVIEGNIRLSFSDESVVLDTKFLAHTIVMCASDIKQKR